ncbi:MAG: ribulose-phosphate 3-epimerase [Nitrospiraceae bacterium]|nr:ribulose-phosphate 3-epimerase [Nitrospiraceae bacterium]
MEEIRKRNNKKIETGKGKAYIAPSLLSADFLRLGEELKATEEAGADVLHVDIMDGHFVPNMTIGPAVVKAIRSATVLPMDVHLMIENADRYLDDFIEAGADFITVHMEACVHLNRTVNYIKKHGVRAGVALNPATPVSALQSIIYDLDMVLIMSVNPGFGGQAFIPHALEKITEVKRLAEEKNQGALIEVDGGVKPGEIFETVALAGADILVMGSAFYGTDDYSGLIRALRK